MFENTIIFDEYYSKIASVVAERSTCNRRQYGAVVVDEDGVVSCGYNGAAKGEPNCCDTGYCAREGLPHNVGYTSACPAVHAEANAIIRAGIRAKGATLYLFGWQNGKKIEHPEPCEMCRRLIINAGIKEVKGL